MTASTSHELTISSSVFTWLYQTSGCQEEDVLAKTGLSRERWQALIKSTNTDVDTDTDTDTVTLPISQINTLAELYSRPITAFLIPEPPKDNPIPQDFRRVPNRSGYSKDLCKKFIKAQRSLRFFAEMTENIGESPHPSVPRFSIQDDSFKAAESEHSRLEINKLGISRKSDWAWKEWRDFISEHKIPVFQYNLDADNIAGFVTKWNNSYGIVVNSKDNYKRRIFTLFHEYAHILLGVDPVCSDDGAPGHNKKADAVELWCDNFAGAFLMPEKIIRENEKITRLINEEKFVKAAEELGRVAGVSPSAALVRLRVCKLIPSDAGEKEFREWKAAALERKTPRTYMEEEEENPQKTDYKIDAARLRVSELGPSYLSLAERNYADGKISYASYLDSIGISKKSHERLRKKGVM